MHITSTHKPGSDATVGKRSNFKKNSYTHTQDHGDAKQQEGRVCPRTLVDRKRKRYDNMVDVVVRLHDPTNLSTERTTPPRSAHVQLGDVPRTLDPVETRESFVSTMAWRWC